MVHFATKPFQAVYLGNKNFTSPKRMYIPYTGKESDQKKNS